MTGTVQENSKTSRTRLAVVAIVILAAATAAGFVSARGGVFKKVRGAYDRWSLRSRVDSLWESRLQGDLSKAAEFVINDGKPRVALGRAVRYLAYEVQEMTIEDEKAQVKLAIRYRLDLPGFSSEKDPPTTDVVKQTWVRSGGGWYWDPGFPPASSNPIHVEPDANAPAPTQPPAGAPAAEPPKDTAQKR